MSQPVGVLRLVIGGRKAGKVLSCFEKEVEKHFEMIFPRLKPRARVKAILKENLWAEFSPRFVIVSVGCSKSVIAEFTLWPCRTTPSPKATKQTTVSINAAIRFHLIYCKKIQSLHTNLTCQENTINKSYKNSKIV